MTTAPRRIGPVLATFLVANNMIGSGFFLLPATLAKSGGVTALAWVLGTALAVVLGAAFARLAREYPDMQSPDDYVRPSLGRDAGFLATTLYWATCWLGNSAIAVAAFGYLSQLLPFPDTMAVRIAGQLSLIWLMFAVNLMGPRPVAKFQSLCVVFGLLPVAVVLTAGWAHFDPALYRASWNVTDRPDAAVVMSALAPVFWAFVGLETGAMVAGIVRDPERNVPIATIGGILVAGVVYLVASVLMMGIVPASVMAASSAPFALVAGMMFGGWAVPLIAAAAALKATGTLGGWLLVAGEMGARAARRGLLPSVFGRLWPNGAAMPGLLLVTLGMSAVALASSAGSVGAQFEFLINAVLVLNLLAYAAAALSLMFGTRARPADRRDKLLGFGALLACGLLLASTPPRMLLVAVIAVLLAWAAWRAFGPPAGAQRA